MKYAIQTLVLFSVVTILVTGCDNMNKKPVKNPPSQTENPSEKDKDTDANDGRG